MTTDAQRASIHAILDRIAAARTPGEAIDTLPENWERFLTGPDGWGFHFSMHPAEAPDLIGRIYDRGLSMGKGKTQMEAILSAVQWIRERMPRPESTIDLLKDRAIALTLMTETLNTLYVKLEAEGNVSQAETVNAQVQRLATEMDAAQYAILIHFGRGDADGWDESHPLNESLWSGQATPDQIREYA